MSPPDPAYLPAKVLAVFTAAPGKFFSVRDVHARLPTEKVNTIEKIVRALHRAGKLRLGAHLKRYASLYEAKP